MDISRRKLIAGTSALLAFSATGLPRKAGAQTRQLVVGTWGGDGSETLRNVVDGPLQQNHQIEVLQDVGPGDARLTKLLVERQSRRGTLDVAHLSDSDTFIADSQDLLLDIPVDKVPRSSMVLERLQQSTAVPFVYTYRAIIYNEELVDEPPASYAGMWDSKWEGRIGVADPFYGSIIESAALAAGSTVSDYEPAKERLTEWRRMGVRVYPSHEAVAAALNSGEIHLTIGLASRSVFWRNAGIPVRAVLPDEGSTMLVYKATVPKNTRNEEDAWAYLNAMLEPEAQTGLSRTMACNPVVSDVPLPDELVEPLTVTSEQEAKMLMPDFDYILRTRDEYISFWQREFRG